jgi:diadenosine tetraphosphatase ApaH/serine/threonine PP2A family protein phosphatase
MRYLVLTDVHANLEALDACLADARTRAFDRVLVLGDLVGYGADPNAVVERVRALEPLAVVRGNHDKVARGLDQADGFNTAAKRAAQWMLNELTTSNREWLAALPQGPCQVDALVEICHGSPFDEDEYIFDEQDARQALRAATRPLCLFGHTHCPTAFALTADSVKKTTPGAGPDSHLQLRIGTTYLVNPGSVGQPRDGDPRAAYAMVDTAQRRVEWFRPAYAIEEAQAKVIRAGLPETLANRLALGR